jgi:hypothetical protein
MCESHISMIVRTHELSLTVLTQKLTKLCLEVTTSIEHLVDTNIYSKMPQIEKLAAAESPATIVQFGKLGTGLMRGRERTISGTTDCLLKYHCLFRS